MQNQHQHIKGYRELTQLEIDLMNEIKGVEAQITTSAVYESLRLRYCQALHSSGVNGNELMLKLNTFEVNWNNAMSALQTGFMWAVRAIAQPQPLQPPAKVVWHQVDEVTTSEDMLNDEDQLLVESTEGRSLITGATLRAELERGFETFIRFIFLDKLPA